MLKFILVVSVMRQNIPCRIFWTGICIGVTLIWVLYARELALAPLADAGL